jgi:hypothetical protein
MSQASSERGQQELVASDVPAAPDQNIIAQEPVSRARQTSVGSEIALTPSTSTKLPNLPTQLRDTCSGKEEDRRGRRIEMVYRGDMHPHEEERPAMGDTGRAAPESWRSVLVVICGQSLERPCRVTS